MIVCNRKHYVRADLGVGFHCFYLHDSSDRRPVRASRPLRQAYIRLPALRTERDRHNQALAELDQPPTVVTLHPNAVKEYLADLDRLAELVNEDLAHGTSETATCLRKLLVNVTVMPAPAGTAPEIAVRGHLENLLGASPSLGWGRLVAGEGFEPPTSGL